MMGCRNGHLEADQIRGICEPCFIAKTATGIDCLVWIGPTNKGYGKYSGTTAHRAAYQLWVDYIPEGHEIDHLCRNPYCVLPEHLESVTRRENIARQKAAKTKCKYGHAYTDENTHIYKYNGWEIRVCRTCTRERKRDTDAH